MPKIQVRELLGWGIEPNEDRPAIPDLPLRLDLAASERESSARRYHQESPLLGGETGRYATDLQSRLISVRESSEFDGLKWSLSMVDLRKLVAFQRRLAFDPASMADGADAPESFSALLDITLPDRARASVPPLKRLSENVVEFRSPNPNFNVSLKHLECLGTAYIWQPSFGSPYMEVCRYRDRWFLRDGYHRAYALLRKGIFAVPSVVVEAESLEELGADQPWFFPEEILFSEYPPRVTDFQNDKLVVEYERQAKEKVVRLSLEESYELLQEDCLQTR